LTEKMVCSQWVFGDKAMTKVCEAVYENGVFKPVGTEPVLKEGQRVKIVREEIATEKDHADPAIWFREPRAVKCLTICPKRKLRK